MYCQKCRSPLKLDKSLEDLNPAAFDLLVGATGKSLPERPSSLSSPHSPYSQNRRDRYDRVSANVPPPVFKRTIPASRHGQASQTSPATQSRLGLKDNPGMSFVMLTESQVVPAHTVKITQDEPRSRQKAKRQKNGDVAEKEEEEKSLSHQIEMTSRLFEIISSRSDIDHPICAECTELLVEGLQRRLSVTTKERDAYITFLKNLNTSTPTADEIEAAKADLKEIRETEVAAFHELLALEKEKGGVDDEIAALEEESRHLDLEEEKFWRDRNSFSLTLSEFQNERDGLNMKYDHDSRQLERLQRTNVYNDTFCIGHDGYFGTINGLRLGRLANPSVGWSEINAAWGQTLLLLATVAEKLGFQFQGYRLKPMGSTSRIDKLEYPQQSTAQSASTNPNSSNQGAPQSAPKITPLDLFSSGDLPLGRMWLHRRFDAGMVAFLDCLHQLGEFVEKTPSRARHSNQGTTGLKLPYAIKKDKINDASIKLGFNQDETWTRACKFTLTCCKFLLAHASNVGGSSASPGRKGGTRE